MVSTYSFFLFFNSSKSPFSIKEVMFELHDELQLIIIKLSIDIYNFFIINLYCYIEFLILSLLILILKQNSNIFVESQVIEAELVLAQKKKQSLQKT